MPLVTPTRLLSPFPNHDQCRFVGDVWRHPTSRLRESLLRPQRPDNCAVACASTWVGARPTKYLPLTWTTSTTRNHSRSSSLIYVAPETVWRTDMRRFHERFRAAPQTRDYFAFLKATDGLLHTQGPGAPQCGTWNRSTRSSNDIRAFCGNETEIVMFSDHGMNLEENQRVDLVTHLAAQELQGLQVG